MYLHNYESRYHDRICSLYKCTCTALDYCLNTVFLLLLFSGCECDINVNNTVVCFFLRNHLKIVLRPNKCVYILITQRFRWKEGKI